MNTFESPPIPEELEARLPRIALLAGEALQARALADQLTRELADFGIVTPRLEASPPPQIADRFERRSEANARAHALWHEIENLGGLVMDRELGAIDFITAWGDSEVRLCWIVGEPSIAHWHHLDEPCSARRRFASIDPPHLC